MTIGSAARRLDDAIVDRLQSAVSAIHDRTGADKETTIRNVHGIGAAACAAWGALGMLAHPIVLVPAGIYMLDQIAAMREHHSRIGRADTVRGRQLATMEAVGIRERRLGFRMAYLACNAAIVLLVLATALLVGDVPFADAREVLAVVGVAGAPCVWISMRSLATFLEAVQPPRGDTRTATEHAGRAVSRA